MDSNLVKNKGLTLVELLVASAIGLTGLAIVSSLFMIGIKTASRLSTELRFIQELNDTARFIKDDARRAGYTIDENATGITTWSGTTEVVYISPSNDCIAYAYQFVEGSTSKVRYISIYHKLLSSQENGKVILYTRNQLLAEIPRNITTACSGGEAITDNKTVNVERLEFNKNIGNYQLGFRLSGRNSDDPTVVETIDSVIKIRNWGS